MMEWKKFGVICVLGLTLMAAAGCSDGSKNAKPGEKGKKFSDSVLQSGKSTRIIENV